MAKDNFLPEVKTTRAWIWRLASTECCRGYKRVVQQFCPIPHIRVLTASTRTTLPPPHTVKVLHLSRGSWTTVWILIVKLHMWHKGIHYYSCKADCWNHKGSRHPPVRMLWDSFPPLSKLETKMSNDKQINLPVLLLHLKTRIYASFTTLPYSMLSPNK